jgi:hypothetical protein
LDEIRNAPPPKASRTEMCRAIAKFEASMATHEELVDVYVQDRQRFYDEFEKQSRIEAMYAGLPKGGAS